MTPQTPNGGCLAARIEKDHHVASGQHQVEPADLAVFTGEQERRQIGAEPLEVGCLLACRLQHAAIEVYAHDVDTTAVQLDSDAAGATPGVEHGARSMTHHETGLAVYVVSGGGEPLETFVIGGTAEHVAPLPS